RMELLERESHLAALGDYATDAAAGNGRFVVVTGEAGIGKTALLDAFRESRPDVRWLWSACDGGFTPRPLGPLHEISTAVGGRLRELCGSDGDRNELFAEFTGLLTTSETPVGIVVEDLHWADEATLDWLAYVARRVANTRAIVIATYRDAEPGADDLLAIMMGRVASSAATRRVSLSPLTLDAVRHLSADHDAEQVYAVTGGNPFFVTEVLATTSGDVPPSVADVVRTRVLRHSGPAQRILAGAAVMGRPASSELLASITGVAASALDECVASGTLVAQGPLVGFQHELTRRAVEGAIPAFQAMELHRMSLATLEREGADPAELAHHAVACGDVDAILRHAPSAGRAAADASSHREAIVQFKRALDHADVLPAFEHFELEEALALSLSTRDQWEEAEPHWEQAIWLQRELGDALALSRCLRRYSVCLWRLCRNEESKAATLESFELMRNAEDSAEKALSMYNYVIDEGGSADERRVLLDECLRIGMHVADDVIVGRSLLGQAFLDRTSGFIDLSLVEQALEAGLRANDAGLAACCYLNLYACPIDRLELDVAVEFDEGMAYCLDHEQHTYSVCMRGSRVTELVRRGANAEAIELALATMEETISPVNRMHLGIGLAEAGFRIGRPEARRWLDDTWDLAVGNDEPFWLVQIATAAAQGAWLTGDAALVTDRVFDIHRRGQEDDPWMQGELSAWLLRLGHPVTPGRDLPSPFSLEVAGDHLGAAAAWRALGCPFEEAVALTWTGESASMRRAFEIFTELGSEPAASHVRRLLAERGDRVAARRPRGSTLAHPAGLTAREAEVLDLLTDGLTNADIAGRLFLSTRTVDHHVSAVLGKLGVSSRGEAADRAAALTT
ncbi:MAG: helix-turn-helix transcriptional regulator, partial [Aeromicrobium sp.]|nr:helix-turn-helix transcriptional regulator [Aeromicrobium sp.]